MRPIPFAVQAYKHDTLPLSAQDVVNCYAEAHPRGAKTPVSVHGFPGLAAFSEVGTGPVRGFFEQNGVLYAIANQEFYSITSAGVATIRGTGITGYGVVSIDGNGTQVAVTNGTLGFIYTESSAAFAQISDAQFNAAKTVTAIDSYFVFDWKDTNKFFNSDLSDGLSYAALMFATAESKPDRVLAVKNLQGVLKILGEKTIESWDSTGAGTPPFQRFDGATVARGIAAPLAVCEEDNAGWLLGNDLIFYRLSGISPVRISTHAIEKTWAGYATTNDAFCFVVIYGGHKFVYVTFPTENSSWGFDIATGLWHRRVSWDPTGVEVRWRANCAIQVFGKMLIGDANTGKIVAIDPDVHTEFDDPVRFILTSVPIFDPGGRRLFMGTFEVDLEAGVGIATGQGSDPQIMLDWSDDGGKTWSAPQLWRSMGKIGEYSVRVQWDRLGSFYQRVLRLQISDPVKRTFIAARADLEVGTA